MSFKKRKQHNPAPARGAGQQAERDQSVAALHGTYLSMPYLDCRVVRAARAIPAEEKVHGGHRKIPLRKVAERYKVDHVVNYRSGPPLKDQVKELTGGAGADVIYDAVGRPVATWIKTRMPASFLRSSP